MGQNEGVATGLARGLGEEGIAGLAGGGFNRELVLAGQGGDIGPRGDEREASGGWRAP